MLCCEPEGCGRPEHSRTRPVARDSSCIKSLMYTYWLLTTLPQLAPVIIMAYIILMIDLICHALYTRK